MSRAWLSGSAAAASAATPASLEWWHATSWPDPLEADLRLWFEGMTPVAWTWHDEGELEWHIWTGDAGRDPVIADEVLETVVAEAGTHRLGAWTADDDERGIARFAALGFRRDDRRLSQWQRHASDGPPEPAPLAPGYRIRGLRRPVDVPDRVALHRAAFPASRLNVEKYERLATLPHYRSEDDLVVEASDGSLAAYALAWWDPAGRVGEFEPVGTHPAHQRRGLARALLTYGLARFFEMGARTVQVYADALDPGPEALYEAVGFRRRAFHLRFERGDATPTGPDLQSTT